MPHELWQQHDTASQLLSRPGKPVQVPEARHESRSGLVNGTHQPASSDTPFAAFLRSGPSNKIRPSMHNHATAAALESSFTPLSRTSLGVRWAPDTPQHGHLSNATGRVWSQPSSSITALPDRSQSLVVRSNTAMPGAILENQVRSLVTLSD